MNHAASSLMRLLEAIFSAGCLGSFLVIVLSAVDDLETMLQKTPLLPESDEPHGVPAYN